MYINEIPVNSDIIIKAKLNNNETSFTTTSIEITDKYKEILENRLQSKFIIVKRVEIDDKIIKFDTQNVKIDIETTINDKCYVWKKVIIRNIEIPTNNKKEKVNIIICDDDVNYINRRNNFRVSIGLRTIITLIKNGKRVNSTIKDFSNTGIGIIVDTDIEGSVGDILRVNFDDTKRKSSFNIECTITRIQNISERKKLFGCIINKIKPDPSYYITRVQRESLQHNK